MEIVIDKDYLKQLSAPEVASLTFFSDFVNSHPDKVKILLNKHEEAFSDDPAINLMKIGALSNERGRYFDDDLQEYSAEAYNFAPAAVGAAISVVKGLLTKAVGAVKSMKADKAAAAANAPDGAAAPDKVKIIDKVKGFFGKMFGKKNPTGINGKDAEDLKKTVTDDKPKDDEKKLILGLKPVAFYSIVAGLVILVVIIIILAVRASKRKKLALKKAA